MDLVTLALAKGYTDKRIEKAELGEIELDKTLTKEGSAADAKAVGEAISKMEGTPGPQGPQGDKGDPGQDGKDGITPHIDKNGNWFIGETDTGMPSRGEPGSTGPSGIHVGPEPPTDPTVHVWVNPDSDDVVDELPAGPAGEDGGYYTPVITQTEAGKAEFSWTASKEGMPDIASQSVTLPQGKPGKSAYQYAQDAGYTGTEEEFAEKLAADPPTGGSGGGELETIADFTATEGTTEIRIPIDTEEMAEKLRKASEYRILLYIPRDKEDSETSTGGKVNIGFYIGWSNTFVSDLEAIPAPSVSWIPYCVSSIYVFRSHNASLGQSSPILIAQARKNDASTSKLTQGEIYTDTLTASGTHYIYVGGSQNMAPGTRFIMEVRS